MATVDVQLPTFSRRESLIATLSGLAAQTLTDPRVVVADQSDEPANDSHVIQALTRLIEARGGAVEWHVRPQVHGIAEQRDFLLSQARADAVLYLDDDVFVGPDVIARLLRVLRE
jgi:GT2 family glycosyltransferase